MDCRGFQDLVDRYAAGTATAAERAEAEEHLRGCGACRADLAAAEFLVPKTTALSPEIAPPRDLWPEIRRRLVPARRGLPRWGLLAAGIALVAASSGLTWLMVGGRAPVAPLPPGAVFAIEVDYAEAAAELSAVLAERERELSPETAATLKRNLGIIDRALAESRDALARDPANPGLETLLRATYDRKLDLLRQAVVLPPRS